MHLPADGREVAPRRSGERHPGVRVWRGPEGAVPRKGTAAITGLWLASVGTHFALGLWIDHAAV
ncbi:hypothetical protein EKH77_32200 [Streptomyces luteoverticillatus]|uniref:Uncharacterized protein n=1 Tax=Streptomyces luteoverticillatus TaxID=66425 RepID=A0A3S9PS38_STRLT|nr:hypothetical protein EKH77_32200 [Streptomyces luteoverticillatus]